MSSPRRAVAPLPGAPASPGGTSPSLSIVIPVGPGDRSWAALLDRLLPELDPTVEVILSATTPAPEESPMPASGGAPIHWIEGNVGRARQLNHGAAQASGAFLWFLHADSQPEPGALRQLLLHLSDRADALWYFDLRFRSDGPRWVRLNQRGANFRARVLGLPFGDQGFLLRSALFRCLGGFDESAPYGEDHLLVWSARRQGVAVLPVGMPLYTSARTYAAGGWLRVTLRHLARTVRQAVPGAWRALRPSGGPG